MSTTLEEPITDTEAEETSDLPEGWAEARLAEICIPPQYGWTTSADKKGTGVQLLRTTDISGGKIDWSTVPACKKEPESIAKYLLEPGDIVVSRAGSVGVSYLIKDPPEAIFASYLIRFRPLAPVSSEFVSTFLKSPRYWSAIAVESAGIAIPNVNASKLKDISVPLPPLPEQKRIVAKIEQLLTQVNKSRDRLNRVPKILKRFRQSILAAACSGHLTEDWRVDYSGETASALLDRLLAERRNVWARHHKTKGYREPESSIEGELPSLPRDWCWATFDQCASDITVGHVGPMKDHYVPDGVALLRSQNVRPLKFDPTGLVYIPDSFHSALSKSRLVGGEVLVVRSGANTGDACVYPSGAREANCADLVITRPLSGLSSAYAATYIASPEGQERLSFRQTGIAQPHFNIGQMRRKPFPLPPIEEQHEIVRRVEALFKLADRIEKRIAAATKRAEKLTQAILAKAFRGKLVPTEAELARQEGRDYETAEALLDRIRADRAKTTQAATKKTKRHPRKKNQIQVS